VAWLNACARHSGFIVHARQAMAMLVEVGVRLVVGYLRRTDAGRVPRYTLKATTTKPMRA
jgi:hypothetical protein